MRSRVAPEERQKTRLRVSVCQNALFVNESRQNAPLAARFEPRAARFGPFFVRSELMNGSSRKFASRVLPLASHALACFHSLRS